MKFRAFLTLLLSLVFAGQVPSAEPKYALLVGVTKYENARMNEPPLQFPEEDATSVGELLKSSGYKVQLLLGKAATKTNVATALEETEQQGTAEGVVLIGLFGHGVQYADDAYFCTYDTGLRRVKDAQGNSLFDDNGIPKQEPNPESMISMKAVLNALNLCGAKNRVLLADCCREDPNAARGRAFGSSVKISDLKRGTAALFSCSENEQAFEHPDWQHGAFTLAFLNGCKALAAEEKVRANRLVGKVYDDVERMVQEKTNGRSSQTVNPIINGIVDLKLSATLAKVDTSTPKMKLPSHNPASPPPNARGDSFQNSIGMTLKLIPAGSFMMGSDSEDADDNEQPVHQVSITKPFYMQTTEVTKGQWKAVMGTEPWKGQDYVKEGASYAATHVAWGDAVAFCNQLSQREGKAYRLPTEAEWEYACRAGTTTNYVFGDDQSRLDDYAWFGGVFDGNCEGERYAHEVGQKRPNPWGLYDMHGNVEEWCSDWYDSEYYSASSAFAPKGPFSGASRVLRGGSWDKFPSKSRTACRGSCPPDWRLQGVGFRVVCE